MVSFPLSHLPIPSSTDMKAETFRRMWVWKGRGDKQSFLLSHRTGNLKLGVQEVRSQDYDETINTEKRTQQSEISRIEKTDDRCRYKTNNELWGTVFAIAQENI